MKMRLRKKGLNIQLPCKLSFLLLGIYPKELKIWFLTKTYKLIFIATLFMIVPKWK